MNIALDLGNIHHPLVNLEADDRQGLLEESNTTNTPTFSDNNNDLDLGLDDKIQHVEARQTDLLDLLEPSTPPDELCSELLQDPVSEISEDARLVSLDSE